MARREFDETINEEEMAVEMEATEASMELSEDVTTDEPVWTVDGEEVSMSVFVRHQFTEFNKSRKQIAEEFGINYRTVYGATVNMTNDAEPTTRGRSAVNSKVKVTEDGRIVVKKEDGTYLINGEVIEEGEVELLELEEHKRNEWLREQVEAGVSRKELAKYLDLSYGVIYNITKDLGGSRSAHTVEDPETGETISRNDYIRKLAAAGKTKAEIRDELDCEYSVVWTALNSGRSDQEKFISAVEKLSKYSDMISEDDKEAFASAIGELKAITFVADDSDDSEDATEQ